MNPEFRKGLLKWALCVAGIIGCFLIFGDCGIVFGAGLCFVIIRYM